MIKSALIILLLCGLFTILKLMGTMNNYNDHIAETPIIKAPKMHACVRTKDSTRFMREFILYHTAQGIQTFSIYDDSEKNHKEFFDDFPGVIFYKYVNGINIENENHFILECVSGVIMSGEYEFVLNMDDDEFLFSTTRDRTVAQHLSINKDVWFANNECISNALYFFGSVKSNNTGYTTIDFVNRDRDVEGKDFKFFYRPYSNRLKNRIEKAIFKVPSEYRGKVDMINAFTNRLKTGIIIHGYSMNCTKQTLIKVAHYTRSGKELEIRLAKFWTNVKGLRGRFDNDKKIKNYLKERNRTEFIDTRLRDTSIQLFS